MQNLTFTLAKTHGNLNIEHAESLTFPEGFWDKLAEVKPQLWLMLQESDALHMTVSQVETLYDDYLQAIESLDRAKSPQAVQAAKDCAPSHVNPRLKLRNDNGTLRGKPIGCGWSDIPEAWPALIDQSRETLLNICPVVVASTWQLEGLAKLQKSTAAAQRPPVELDSVGQGVNTSKIPQRFIGTKKERDAKAMSLAQLELSRSRNPERWDYRIERLRERYRTGENEANCQWMFEQIQKKHPPVTTEDAT